jgi:hypothetical protein
MAGSVRGRLNAAFAACLFVGSVLIASGEVMATEYYVSPQGNDGAAGTSADSSFRTIGKEVKLMTRTAVGSGEGGKARGALGGVSVIAVALLLCATALAAENSPVNGGSRATINDTPQEYLQAAIGNAKKHMDSQYTGVFWTWHARFPMNGFIDSYLATGDTAWLDAAVEYFDWNIGLLLTGPDGYQGWLGPAYRMEGKLGEHPGGDANVIKGMVRFSALVLKDEPALAEKYRESARSYVDLARRLMFEKWEKRGIWHEDGPYGAFTEWPWYFTEQEADRWHEPPEGMRAITLPINYQVKWGITAARLYQITGNEAWRRKALQLFNFIKSRLCLYQDHYSWNYWEPFGPWDVDPGNPQAFRHWVGTPHPYRDYQATELEAFVEAFHHGITFDADDMMWFVTTNRDVMWNGDLDEIKWNNSNAGVQKAALGAVRLLSKPAGIFDHYAGTLWTALAEFDPVLRQVYETQLKPGSYQHAYYYNVTRRRAPSYTQRHPERPATVFHFPFSSCSTITMAAVMPSVVQRDKPALVACQGRLAGDLRIELRSDDGTRRLAILTETSLQGPAFIFNLPWNAGDLKPGHYRVRWTLKDQYREFPVEVR